MKDLSPFQAQRGIWSLWTRVCKGLPAESPEMTEYFSVPGTKYQIAREQMEIFQ